MIQRIVDIVQSAERHLRHAGALGVDDLPEPEVDIVSSAERPRRPFQLTLPERGRPVRRAMPLDDAQNPTLPAALNAEVWENRRRRVVWTGLTGLTGLYEHTDLFAANAAHANAVRREQIRVF